MSREDDLCPDDAPCEGEACKGGSDRRTFLKGSVAAGAAGLAGCRKAGDGKAKPRKKPAGGPPVKPSKGPAKGAKTSKKTKAKPTRTAKAAPRRSKVIQVQNSKAYDAKGRPASKPVKAMVDQAVMLLTGKSSPKAAWSSLFKPSEKVGLKPNCLGRHMCWPHPATVDAIIEGLLSAGVPYKNMYMWDMWGFGASPLSRRYKNSAMHVKPIKVWGYSRKSFKLQTSGSTQLTKPLLLVDAVVNIPVIKDHDLAGVTCSLKNMALGSVPKPSKFHANSKGKRFCDPGVPEIYSLPVIKDKVRLHLVDAFNIIIDGGPKGNRRGQRKLHSVLAATDPVALDRIAWKIIDEHREKARLKPLMKKPLARVAPRGRPYHVLTAQKMGLGTANLKKIEHVIKSLG